MEKRRLNEETNNFFSHSSKDREAVLLIKNKLDKLTGGVIDIFMSSDGQSIPFGTNWIHKIEEGLQDAEIMFVFVTENSLPSGWIYFEAGFAYSKGIQVIPVGIGVDVGTLKAPLNLLQGFNILSKDSLGNFITIINRTFNYRFEGEFEHADYLGIEKELPGEVFYSFDFEKIIDKIECEIYGEQTIDNKKVTYDIDKFFNDIMDYLKTHSIPFSLDDERTGYLVANGVRIIYNKEKISSDGKCEKTAKIKFYISPYNFIKSFSLFKELLQMLDKKDGSYVQLHLKDNYSYVASAEDGSSIISSYPEFQVTKGYVGGYECNELGLRFYIFDCNKWERNKNEKYIASVTFSVKNVQSENIMILIKKLYDMGFIYEE